MSFGFIVSLTHVYLD